MTSAGNINNGSDKNFKVTFIASGNDRTQEGIKSKKGKIDEKIKVDINNDVLFSEEYEIMSILNEQIMTADVISEYFDLPIDRTIQILENLFKHKYVNKIQLEDEKSNVCIEEEVYYSLTKKGYKKLQNSK